MTCPNEFIQAGSPVSGGVVTLSEASGKVANRKVRTEVSQTAVSVLTNRNYIRRPLGRMRYHMLPKSNPLKKKRIVPKW